MRLLDEQYTKTPFYGIPRMTAWLKEQGLISLKPESEAINNFQRK